MSERKRTDCRSRDMRSFVGAYGELHHQFGSLKAKLGDAVTHEYYADDDVDPLEPKDLDLAYELEMIENMVGRMRSLV